MNVTTELVDKLANLTMLQFNEEEKKDIQNDLQSMISFVEKLQELDTNGVEPLQHISSNNNVLREDNIKPSISKEEAFLNAPLQHENYFAVSKIIKK